MKKSDGFVKHVSGVLAERNASSKDLFDMMYELDVAERDVQAMIADSGRLERDMNELDTLEKQLKLHQEGTPEYQTATRRLEEIFKSSKNPRPKQPEFRKAARNALLRLKYDALQVIYMAIFYLVVIVFNVAAFIGFIYFLPTIVEWLF